MARIGLLTGTFDPVHRGHIELARRVRGAAGLDEVWFLVNPDPAHKVTVVPWTHRMAMVRLALAGEPGLRLVEESHLAGIPHTWPGFSRFFAQYPEQVFEFIVGLEVLAHLPTWEHLESVVLNTSYVVVSRPQEETAGVQESIALLQRLQRTLESDVGARLKARSVELSGLPAISSTQIRQGLKQGEVPVALSPPIADYIRSHHLYA